MSNLNAFKPVRCMDCMFVDGNSWNYKCELLHQVTTEHESIRDAYTRRVGYTQMRCPDYKSKEESI